MNSFDTLVRELMRLDDIPKQIVICAPDKVDAVQALVDRYMLGGVWKVQSSPLCDGERLYLVNDPGPHVKPGPITFRGTPEQSTLW